MNLQICPHVHLHQTFPRVHAGTDVQVRRHATQTVSIQETNTVPFEATDEDELSEGEASKKQMVDDVEKLSFLAPE